MAEAHHLKDRIGHIAPHQPDRTAALIDKSHLNSVSGLASARKPSSTRAELLELAHLMTELAGREQAKLLRQGRRWTLGKGEQVTGNLESDVHPIQGRRGQLLMKVRGRESDRGDQTIADLEARNDGVGRTRSRC